MPISYRYKAIFVHIPKTAGTSIYDLLEIPMQPNALYSPAKHLPSLQHLTPTQLRQRIPKLMSNYYKFTVVRNPYDRAVSDFRFLKSKLPKRYDISTFKKYLLLARRIVRTNAYLENVFFDHFRPQTHYFQNIKYNKVVKFENLENDLEGVKRDLKCNRNLIWRLRTSKVHGPLNYRTYYNNDNELRKIVENIYGDDLKRFNYSF